MCCLGFPHGWEFHDQLWLFHAGGPSKEGNGKSRTGVSSILKLLWGRNMLHSEGSAISNRTKGLLEIQNFL